MPGSYCHITKYAEPQRWARIECGYNPDFISVLKNIPIAQRTYNQHERYWTIAPMWYDKIVTAAQANFNMVTVYAMGEDKAVQLNG
jgi:hypothetical protein